MVLRSTLSSENLIKWTVTDIDKKFSRISWLSDKNVVVFENFCVNLKAKNIWQKNFEVGAFSRFEICCCETETQRKGPERYGEIF